MTEVKLYIKTLKGRITEIYISLDSKIGKGKEKWKDADKSNNNYDPQWKFGSTVLKDDRTFNDYGIEEEDNITTNERAEGGKK